MALWPNTSLLINRTREPKPVSPVHEHGPYVVFNIEWERVFVFSSVKRTLTDARSSLTTETASLDIFTKEWSKSGLAEGVDYMSYLHPKKR
ncbi:hypothetical protein B0H19DRAFT_968666 [Mycena capillaripes]|nr:hypothetical protein B0H19DRAFT_968666 [Mycena capillaripes]